MCSTFFSSSSADFFCASSSAEAQKKSAEEEEKKVEKFGPQYVFILRDLAGEESLVKFRTKTHMRVLMQSIFQRMLLSPEEAAKVTFKYGSHEILSHDTPDQLGMKDHDVIMMQGEFMEKKLARKQAANKRSRAIAKLAAKADFAKNRQRLLDARQSIKQAHRRQAVKDDEALRKHFRDTDMIHLNFRDTDMI